MDLAHRLARAHHLRVIPVTETRRDKTGGSRQVRAWVVYRGACRIGRRQNPRELLRLVKNVAGIA